MGAGSTVVSDCCRVRTLSCRCRPTLGEGASNRANRPGGRGSRGVIYLQLWRPLPAEVWHVSATPARIVLYAISLAGWALVLSSTFAIDHFDLFGVRQVVRRLRGQPGADPDFRTPALYRTVRHPLYLGFVIAFWAAPTMTAGRLLFAAVTTGYILVAVRFEEHDLVGVFGDRYRNYRRQVPMLVPHPHHRGGVHSAGL
ncbi:isoprenylcysteine carboxylmethyltransferase family protein [Nocardia vermiculata]|uniref:Isoprenylcysteine carboxylmethyltransferase family protein n=1 Tax=Nocardia vermiculata TaxID=257274 RepID=A0A846YB22_9NOCA|nr:isoprenylcysteine carboxylmethyltransferase family protein [Nocardia vermiculata]